MYNIIMLWSHVLFPLDIRLTPREFNSYGSRRGNDDVMSRGTFANIRLLNKFLGKSGPKTIHIPSGMQWVYLGGGGTHHTPYLSHLGIDSSRATYSFSLCFTCTCCVGDVMDVYDAAERYQRERKAVIILAGKDYGSGNYIHT